MTSTVSAFTLVVGGVDRVDDSSKNNIYVVSVGVVVLVTSVVWVTGD